MAPSRHTTPKFPSSPANSLTYSKPDYSPLKLWVELLKRCVLIYLLAARIAHSLSYTGRHSGTAETDANPDLPRVPSPLVQQLHRLVARGLEYGMAKSKRERKAELFARPHPINLLH